MDALVTDVHLANAVAGLRALGAGGLHVLAVGPSWAAAGLWSRYAAGAAIAPDAVKAPGGFASEIARLARTHGPLVVYPGTEEAVDVLSAPSTTMPSEAVLPYAARPVLDAVRDKRRLSSLARANGLRAPRTLLEGTAAELVATDLPARAMLKAAVPGGAMERVYAVESAGELRRHLERLPAGQPVLLQEQVAGPLMAVALVLAKDGSVAARFQQVAQRTWPAGAGRSSFARSVAPDEGLVATAARMLAESGYWGLAQLQFIATREGPFLIDVNVRFYGSLPLARASGVDLPGAWHAVALDRPVSAPGPYRVGVTYRWLEGEISATVQGRRSAGDLLTRARRPRVGAMWAREDSFASLFLGARGVTDRVRRRAAGPVADWLGDRPRRRTRGRSSAEPRRPEARAS